MYPNRIKKSGRFDPIENGEVSHLNGQVVIGSNPLNEFVFEETQIEDVPSYTLTSDVTLLFNQQRLDKMSQLALANHFESLSKSSDPLNQIRSKLTDKQLAMFVKSRFIQSNSELLAWSQYLMDNYDSVSAEMQALIDAQNTASPNESAPTEPTE